MPSVFCPLEAINVYLMNIDILWTGPRFWITEKLVKLCLTPIIFLTWLIASDESGPKALFLFPVMERDGSGEMKKRAV